jgi:ABC-2 type transport system ATP-binding protein
MTDYVIETDRLTKHYGAFEAVRELSLGVPRGSITGFLGQNGAGKSSTLKMLLGMMRPTRGGGRVLGFDIADERQSVEMRRRVAYVSEDKRLYDYMTVAQLIRFTKAFYPTWRDDVERRLLADFRLPPDRAIRKLSKGMRTQTALLLALARGAELLILDEPTEGLDPVVTEKVLELVVGAAAGGATVFFSSHQIAEVEQVADRVLLIDSGRLLLDASLDEIQGEFRRVHAVYDAPPSLDPVALGGAAARVEAEGRSVSVIATHDADVVAARLRTPDAVSVDVLPLTLKDVVLETLRRS